MRPRLALPGRVLMRLAPGLEMPAIAAHRDVRTGYAVAAEALDGGPVEKVLRRHAEGLRATRAFVAKAGVHRPGHGGQGFDAVEERLGLSRTYRIDVGRRTRIRELLEDLSQLAQVEMASPIYLCETPFSVAQENSEPAAPDQARQMIGAREALEVEGGDPALIVGLVDSGCAKDHPELQGRLRPGLNTVSAGELGADVQLLSAPRADRQDVADDEGHGTAVASVIGATGVSLPPGLAGAASMLPMRALCGARMPGSPRPTAIGNLADIDSALKTAVDLGARVLNLSFGTAASQLDPRDPVPHVAVVRYALDRGCVLVSASGNNAQNEPFFPAALPGVIAVGSVGLGRLRSSFSTGGPHVALCAPGEHVRVAALDGYGQMSGTSVAAPLVTAACALMLARAARLSTPLAPDRVRELLQRSASRFAPGDPRTTEQSCGAGILDVPAALRAVEEECRAQAA